MGFKHKVRRMARTRAAFSSLAEMLELRRLLSVDISLTSDAGANQFYIALAGSNVEIFQNQPLTSTPVVSDPVANVSSITITNGGGNLDQSGSSCFQTFRTLHHP